MGQDVSAVSSEPLNYDDTMSGDKLNKIAQKFITYGDYDNARICLSMAIDKGHTKSMLQLGTYYEQVEPNVDEMIRLYTLTYENGNKEGAFQLASYYTKMKNESEMIKYLVIGAERFNDRDAIYNLIIHYLTKEDKDNSLKFCDKLIENNPNAGHYMKGHIFEKFNDIDCMKIHYHMFLTNLPPNPVGTQEDGEKILDVIKIYMHNEIDLPFIQSMLHKFQITDSGVLGHLQFKINKTKLSNYKMNGDCMICYETKDIQMFDCLGHHYCLGCIMKIQQCAVCKCSRKCMH
jgi:tetratricopeptide (TPR) repeat protein